MNEDLFEPLEQALRSRGPDTGFELLIERLRQQKKYPLIFEARLMRKRLALGQPMLQSGNISDLPAEHQAAYEAALREAAHETGALFLADGDIARAWPYFCAVGDPAPVAEAIERLPAGAVSEPVIQIALNEGVHPRKGFELLLEQQGICTAMSFASQYPDRAGRLEFLQLLVRAITRELAANLKEAITGAEGRAPESGGVSDLIAGRDWLFADARYYTENSHLASMVQAAPELPDIESLRLAWELAEYGRRLDPMYQFPSEPPFSDIYVDYGAYLAAILDEDRDAALAHFRKKIDDSVAGSAEILVGLLTRIGRYREALEVSLQYLGGDAGRTCPSALQLCQMAGDYRRMMQLAREEGDLLAFAAGVLQGS
jgi:hypothetical protein